MKQFLEKLKNKQDLSFEESKSAFNILMNGEADDEEIFETLVENQKIASEKLAEKNIKALIEPINTVDQPGFFINTSKQGMDLIKQINHGKQEAGN